MGEIHTEIANAVNILNLSKSDIELLGDEAGKVIFDDCLNHFVQSGDRRWWWEDFQQPSFSFYGLVRPFERLNEIIPNLEANVWLIVEDVDEPFYPVYDAKPTVISDIIGECFLGFEYYIIDKNKKWLLCENHHHRLIGIGDELRKFNREFIVRPLFRTSS